MIDRLIEWLRGNNDKKDLIADIFGCISGSVV